MCTLPLVPLHARRKCVWRWSERRQLCVVVSIVLLCIVCVEPRQRIPTLLGALSARATTIDYTLFVNYVRT